MTVWLWNFLKVNFLQYSYSYIGLCYIVYKLSPFLDLVALVWDITLESLVVNIYVERFNTKNPLYYPHNVFIYHA